MAPHREDTGRILTHSESTEEGLRSHVVRSLCCLFCFLPSLARQTCSTCGREQLKLMPTSRFNFRTARSRENRTHSCVPKIVRTLQAPISTHQKKNFQPTCPTFNQTSANDPFKSPANVWRNLPVLFNTPILSLPPTRDAQQFKSQTLL